MIISIIVMINMTMMIVNIITMVSNMRNMIMVWWLSFDQLIIIIVNIMVMINWSWWSSKSSWWSVIGGLWSFDQGIMMIINIMEMIWEQWSWWLTIDRLIMKMINTTVMIINIKMMICNHDAAHLNSKRTTNNNLSSYWAPKTSGNLSMIRCRWYNWLNKKASWKILNLKMKSIEN